MATPRGWLLVDFASAGSAEVCCVILDSVALSSLSLEEWPLSSSNLELSLEGRRDGDA